jgi:hypothetical protein
MTTDQRLGVRVLAGARTRHHSLAHPTLARLARLGDDLGKQPPGRSSLATGNGVGEEEAVARIEAAFPATVEQGR